MQPSELPNSLAETGLLNVMSGRGSAGYQEFSFKFNLEDTILLGRESSGVPEQVHKNSYERLKIPLKNNARSLNIAIAVGITLTEALKQNNF